MSDINRSALMTIQYLLRNHSGVVVLGARQVGKTTLAKKVIPDAAYIDLERDRDFDRVQPGPAAFLRGVERESLIIDEIGGMPELIPCLRASIDSEPWKKGRYLILSSGAPGLEASLKKELGDRVVFFDLGGLHLEEAWSKEPSYLYEMILNGQPDALKSLVPEERSEDLFESCLRGSFPRAFTRRENGDDAVRWLEDYFRDFLKGDIQTYYPGLNVRVYHHFFKMLVSASGYVNNSSNFSRSLDISVPTIQKYQRLAEEAYLWRSIPAWPYNRGKRLVKMPKGHIRDSGLLNFYLDIEDQEALRSHVNLRAVWKSFIIEELLKGFQNRLIPVKTWFYKTHNGAEVDLILEGEFGILPVDIKLGLKTPKGKIRAMSSFIREFDCPYGIVINNSAKVKNVTPKVLQIPATCL